MERTTRIAVWGRLAAVLLLLWALVGGLPADPAFAGRAVAALSAVDPGWQLLMGPVYAVPRALERAGIAWGDLGLVEIHEAFAAQVLSNVQAWGSSAWADRLGLAGPVGEVGSQCRSGSSRATTSRSAAKTGCASSSGRFVSSRYVTVL